MSNYNDFRTKNIYYQGKILYLPCTYPTPYVRKERKREKKPSSYRIFQRRQHCFLKAHIYTEAI